MRLISDFRDYYDHAFDLSFAATPALYRMARTERHRRVDHDALERVGLKVPERGMLSAFATDRLVVAYKEPTLHRGGGKLRALAGELLREHGDLYASAWVGPLPGGQSERLLAVGRRMFWLAYFSTSGWMSNRGDVHVTMEGGATASEKVWRKRAEEAVLQLQHDLRQPLLAVDFVGCWALDLNTSPGMQDSPVEQIMRPAEVHEAVEDRAREISYARLGADPSPQSHPQCGPWGMVF